ncbi:monovalent cation/H+ antiporter subunit A [Usitatibacter palustris]|uniref:NAD(P)H-quinone oxidoreductase subunit 2, chloroplastic n=1 Tax=Usitatibacter palustris TaxID=2732487 RepID=A0A6M4H8V2_9PROT|nr:monovalent cation/H+ antiporter subunit A [Usitatibacter palustris]QJR14814.1 NAD(P)H-quinone oxidoreductase subunit 2, chloroplastic [Usitatibacter palustris]
MLPEALSVLLALPFAGSFAAALFPAQARKRAAWFAGAVALAAHVLAWTAHGSMAQGEIVRLSLPWVPTLGLEFTLRLDGFAWVFALLVTGMGFLVVLYARYYMSASDPVPRFFSYFLAFMGAMLGVVLSGNLVQLVFFWELTSLCSFLLIGYWHRNAAAREGARIAVVITSAGGLCLLAGVLILGRIAGSYDLDAVFAAREAIQADSLYLPALLLVLAGALTKSAQFPFHFWLPHAMSAPTPVSAFLHSASMVKLGVFLMARLWPVLAGTEAWMWIVGSAGLITLVLGAYVAIFQHDLKGLLAYSTVSHLGLITVLLGLNTPLGVVAAVFHMLNHATFKASLFMAAGIVDHETGTRDIRRLSGLYRFMPITATLATVAAAAMAGVPLLNGFLSKEMFFSEALSVEGPVRSIDAAIPYLAVAWGVFSVCYSTRFIHGVFLGPPPEGLSRTPQEPPRWMRFPIELLVLGCLAVGILPALTIGPFLDIAARSILGTRTPEYNLSAWHGLTTPFLMSLGALAGGILLYIVLRRRFTGGDASVSLMPRIDSRSAFDHLFVMLTRGWPRAVERYAGTQRLQTQLRWLALVALAAGTWPVWNRGLAPGPLAATPIDAPLAISCAVGAACAVAAAWQARFHRFAALLLAGGAGLAVCLVFVRMAAPDLALTQLLIEIVTTVLLMLGLRWLPKRSESLSTPAAARASRLRRGRDFGVAAACGAGLATLAYSVMTRPLPDQAISRFFVEHALPDGGGLNVVNVIIVDFRGFDTLGEITVLAVVGLTVYALLRRFRPAHESLAIPPRQKVRADADEVMLVPSVVTRLMFPMIAVLAVYLLWRGHNSPGGGFAAGVALAIGVVLQYLAGGTRWAENRLAIRPMRWIGSGLLLAAATGAGAWLFGHPFLTSHTAHITLPILGELHVPSALLFDLGVFSLVVGATGLLLIALAHQGTRHPWN